MIDTGVWLVCEGGGEGCVGRGCLQQYVPLRSCDGTGVVSVQVCAGRGAGA